jgi:urease alpha subunit
MPNIEIDPETCNVYVDGERVTVKPAKTLPLTQLFILPPGPDGPRHGYSGPSG